MEKTNINMGNRNQLLRRSIQEKIQLMKRFLLLCISFIVFLTAPLLHAAEAAEPSDHGSTLQEILILNSYHPGYAWSDDEQAGIVDVFQAKDKHWLPVIEYLDLRRLPDGRHLAELKQLFRLKYQNKKFSVVIAMDNPALEFAVDNQAGLFGNAPIVFCGINNFTPSLLKGRSEVTGIVEAIDIAGTIEVMLRMNPAAQEIFSPQDYTTTGLAIRKELEALVPRFGAKVRFRFTDPLTMEELLKELGRLPKNSLVLAVGFITDKSGRTFDTSETTKLFYEHSPVPIYSTFEQQLGFGIVGGKLLSARIHGTNAARIALRVLAGEKASAIPVVLESDSQFMFDYKVMSRFGILLSALPEGSTVINKPVSFYAAHRVVIQTALGIIVFMAVVIFLLTINIIQRRRSSEVIRRSEERFKVIASSTPDHLIVQDKDLRYSFMMNPQLGLTEQDMIGKTDYDFLSKEDADKLTEIKRQVLKTGSPAHVEVPLTSSTGEQQFFNGSYIPKFDAKGQVDGLIGYFRNITERKQAEEKLKNTYGQVRSLASRLQEVREETRTTIAHDIHDELGGSLAALKMDLLRLESIASGEEDGGKRQAMLDIIHGTKELINDTIRSTRRIIMEQRPSVLDDFGLVAAMEWQLGEYKTHTGISFEFNVGQIEIDIDKNFATVVFRIFQEALANVIRHSKATEVYINLRVDEGQLILEIKDNGRGITEDELTGTGSMGILGMRERALALGGEINIAGESGKGTTLNLKMPIQ
ncbi:MAG TPA: PAS domain-containing protein [Syntrophales bacterium]